MTIDDTRAVFDGYVQALSTGGDFAAFFAEDVSWTTMETGDRASGREAVRDLIVDLHTRAFEASPEFLSQTIDDGAVALEAVFVGTHTGEVAGVPPTGLQVRLPYSVVYDIADGAITALRAYFPMTLLVTQLREAAAAHA